MTPVRFSPHNAPSCQGTKPMLRQTAQRTVKVAVGVLQQEHGAAGGVEGITLLRRQLKPAHNLALHRQQRLWGKAGKQG